MIPGGPSGNARRTLTRRERLSGAVANAVRWDREASRGNGPAEDLRRAAREGHARRDRRQRSRLCAWGHGHWARAYGVPLEEVNAILGQQAASLRAKDLAEAAALLFAQQYAEENGEVDPESIGNLRRHYDERQVGEILAYVRAITIGNLLGNTVDALLGRFRSRRP